MSFLIPIIIIGSLLIAGRIFRPRTPSEKPDPFSVPNIDEGEVLPVLFGTQPITPTIIEWGNTEADTYTFNNVQHNEYFAGMCMAICEGFVDYYSDIQFGGKSLAAWPANTKYTFATGAFSPPISTLTGPTFQQVYINALNLYGGPDKDGGVGGVARLYFGSPSQGVDARLVGASIRTATGTGTDTTPSGLPDIAYIAFDGPSPYIDYHGVAKDPRFYWGNFAQPPTIVVIASRYPVGPGTAGINNTIVNGHDANPAYVIWELLTHKDATSRGEAGGRWGAGMATASFNTTSITDAAVQLAGEGVGVSFLLKTQQSYKQTIDEVLRHIGGVLYRDPVTGLIGLKLIRDDYNPATLPVISEDNAHDFVVDEDQWSLTTNEMKIKSYRLAGKSGVTATTTAEALTGTFKQFGIILWEAQLTGRNVTNVVVINHTNSTTATLVAGADWTNNAILENAELGILLFQEGFFTNVLTDDVTVSYAGFNADTAFKLVPSVTRFYDLANQQTTGEVRIEEVELPYFTTDIAVAQRGAVMFKEASVALGRGSFKMNREGNTLYPGAVIKLTVAMHSLSNYIVRIADVNYGDLDDEEIEIDWVQDLFASYKNFVFGSLDESVPPASGGTSLQTAPPMAIGQAPCGSIDVTPFVADTGFNIELYRATVSSGTASVLVTTVPGTTTNIHDTQTPGSTFWYAARLVLAGWNPGPLTAWQAMVGFTGTTTGCTATCTAPTIGTVVAQSTATGTLTLSITDPQHRLLTVETKTKAGTAPESQFTAFTATPYTKTVALDCTNQSVITYRVTYLDCTNATATLTGSVTFAAVAAPTLTARFLPTGALVADWVLPDTAQSIKIVGSFTAQPDATAVLATTALTAALGTTDPLTGAGTATAGMIGFVSAIAFAGASGSGCTSVLVTTQAVFGSGGSGGGGLGSSDVLGCVCVWEPHVLKAGSYLTLPNVPVAETDLADVEGVSQFAHWTQNFGCSTNMTAQLQTHISGSAVNGDLALQYYNGSTWRYWDGNNGPFVSLAGTGLQAGAKVQCEAAMFGAARECRIIIRNGAGTLTSQVSMLAVERCVFPASTPTQSTVGTTTVDCCTVASDGFEYTSTAAMIAAGWTFNGGTSAFIMDTVSPKAGTYDLKMQILSGGWNIPFYLKSWKTFTLAPNTWYTVSVWTEQESVLGYDANWSHIVANGVTSTQSVTVSNTYVLLSVNAMADSGGLLVVTLQRDMPANAAPYLVYVHWDTLRIQAGSGCTPTSAECTAKPFVWVKAWGYDQIVFSTATGETNHLVSDSGFGYAYNSNPAFIASGGYGNNPPTPSLPNDYQVSVVVHAHSPVTGGGGFGGAPYGPNLSVVGGVVARRPSTAGFFNYAGYYFDYNAETGNLTLYGAGATGSHFASTSTPIAGGLLETDVTLTLMCQGTTLTGLVNGTAVLTLIDSTYTTGGGAGLRAGWKPGQGAYVKGTWSVKNPAGTTTYLSDALTDSAGVVLSNHTPN